MEFEIKNIQKSINDVMRTIGYKPAYFQKEGEASIVRQLGGGDYPRFHLYIKQSFDSAQDKLNTFVFNLHLDQKKPSYFAHRSFSEGGSRTHAHSGDYDGQVVEGEARRIQSILNDQF